MGSTTTWWGASFGGMMRPLSSPCVMMIAPMKRVERPHDVVKAYACSLFTSLKVMSKARAKFSPM